MNPTPFLSVVIPAYNESARLPVTLTEIRPYLSQQKYSYEVLVVDDGSKDNTVDLTQKLAAQWPELRCLSEAPHEGKGACVRRGCLAAKGELILVMDADHPTPIDTLEFLFPHFKNGYDVVVGVRTFCGQEGSSGRFRRIVGLIQQLMAHIIVFEQSVADSQCGFKIFKNQAAQDIFSRSRVKGGMYDVELFLIAQRLNIPIYSQPVRWVNKDGSTINILKCMLQDPFCLLSIRLRKHLGKYD